MQDPVGSPFSKNRQAKSSIVDYTGKLFYLMSYTN